MDAIAKTVTVQAPDIPANVVRLDHELSDRIAAIEKAKHDAYIDGNQGAARSCESQIRDVRIRQQAFISMLRDKHPVYAAARYPLPLDLPRAALRDNEFVVVYDITDSGLLVFVLRGKQIVKGLFKPIARDDLKSLVQKFIRSMDMSVEASVEEGLSKFDFAAGKQLADLLLGDALPLLPEATPVIIVPDGALCRLPFEALGLNEGGKVKTNGNIPHVVDTLFFADRNDISYAASITTLSVSRLLRGSGPMGDRTLVMVDPIFSREDGRLRNTHSAIPYLMSLETRQRTVFSRLPLTQHLGETLAKIAPEKTDVHMGMKASKEVLIGKDLSSYRAIVIATHEYYERDIPGFSEPVMVLSLVNQPQGQDGFLRVSEVAGLNLNADIVALVSGAGRCVEGEGIMSMSWAFQYAGARSVLENKLVPAEGVSVRLLESFFKHWSEGKSKLEALRLARKELRESGYDHPFFWASIGLVGEDN